MLSASHTEKMKSILHPDKEDFCWKGNEDFVWKDLYFTDVLAGNWVDWTVVIYLLNTSHTENGSEFLIEED